MTLYPLDLTLHESTNAKDVDAGFASLASGRDLLINLIVQTDTFDGDALVYMLRKLDRVMTLNLRMTDGVTQPEITEALAAFCAGRGIPFHVDLLIPEGADVVDFTLRGKGTLVPIVDATRACIGRGLNLRWLIPLTPDLVYRLEELVSLAFQNGTAPVLLPQSVLDPDAPDLTGDHRLFAWDFVTYRILESDAEKFDRTHLTAYRQLAADLKQEMPRHSDAQGTEVWGTLKPGGPLSEAHRDLGGVGKALLAAGSDAGQTGYNRREILDRRAGDITEVLSFSLSSHLRNLITPAPEPSQPDPRMPFVLLIGAYGGEHIGDAAILGGVLSRIHARHGTQRAILMTQRPNHTRHLIPMLDVPVKIDVWDYTYANIARALRDVDGVVFAGGPLADMPKQLVRHLETVTRAKRKGLPFVMEGVGPNTFPRMLSRVTARKLVKLADRITIRVPEEATRAVIAGCEIEIGHDPAFDYLDTRKEVLNRLPAFELPQIEELLAGTECRPVIGINLRPIGHLYTPAAPGRDPATYTRRIEDQFEREFAKGLMDFARQSGAKPCFVFFPMNAIQFGMCDLRCAWRVMQHLDPDTDFRIWQADASLDGVVALLRRMDTVIAMRFHAAIFALSQNLPVIGIDYGIGKNDKVAAVLAGAGAEANCSRIDTLRADWLTDQLRALCALGTTE